MTAREMWAMMKGVSINMECDPTRNKFKMCAQIGDSYCISWIADDLFEQLRSDGYKIRWTGDETDGLTFCRISWDFSEEDKFKLDGPEYQAAVKEMSTKN